MSLKNEIKSSFPDGINFPNELSMLCDWAEKKSNISAGFTLHKNDDAVKYWFGSDVATEYLAVFAHDYDGSLYAIWKSDDDIQRIVFLGSEGEPLWILADNFIDFLRLLAIGYDEIGFSDLTKSPPKDCADSEFKNWVQTTFNVKIPLTGDEIVNANNLIFEEWVDEKIKN
jgi:hypothetical protein